MNTNNRKIGIVGILNNPATSLNSHSAGWNEIMRQLIDPTAVVINENDDWNDYDKLVINHGLNFKPGSYNIIGGISPSVISRSEKLLTFIGPVYEIDGFDFNDFIAKRKPSEELEEHVKQYPLEIRHQELHVGTKKLIGDSHSISVWPNIDWQIERMDGKTLFGFLKEPKKADWLYFGNIDIRFHLCRQSDPHQATLELVKRYISWAKACNAKVTCLLPVESETRKLPGTGLHYGKPFYGTRTLRSELVYLFNTELIASSLDVHVWPTEWYSDIKHFESEVMEPRQSVHLRPKYYANKLQC